MTRENNETGQRHNLDKVKRAGGTPALRNGSFTGNASEVCGEGRLSIRPMFNGFGAWAL